MSVVTMYEDVPGFAPEPSILAEPRLTAGHLLLCTPGRPGTPSWWATGSPTIPNAAAASALALVGSPVPNVTVQNLNTAPSHGLVARTPKNAPHFISSQTAQPVGEGSGLLMNDALQGYLDARRTGTAFFLSVWMKRTRSNTATSPSLWPAVGIKESSLAGVKVGTGFTAAGVLGGTPGSAAPERVHFERHRSGGPDAGNFTNGEDLFVAIATSSLGAVSAIIKNLAWSGSWDGGTTNKAPSFVLTSVELAATAATGKTPAQLAATSYEEWVAQVRTPGGYAYGDTHDNPAVVCP